MLSASSPLEHGSLRVHARDDERAFAANLYQMVMAVFPYHIVPFTLRMSTNGEGTWLSTLVRGWERLVSGTTLGQSQSVSNSELTSREGVLVALERRGGRARQCDLVEATPWSKSTVSRALSRLEASGEVERHKVGREKIVTLPDETGTVDADATVETDVAAETDELQRLSA